MAQTGLALRRKASLQELVLFFRQLHLLSASGIPVHRALHSLQGGEWGPALTEALEHLEESVRHGQSVSRAMQGAGAFPDDCVGLVKVAEETGLLVAVLNRCATLLEKDQARRQKVQAALTYPAVLLVASVVMMVGMVLFFVPRMNQVLTDMAVSLPPPIQLLFWLSEQAAKPANLLMLLELGGVCLALLWWWAQSEKGGQQLDQVMLTLPVLGKVLRAMDLSRLSYSYALMERVGLSAHKALLILPRSLRSPEMARALSACRTRLVEGASLSEAFGGEPIFQGLFARMVEVGERSSSMADVLEGLSRYYEDRLEETLQAATALLEPFILMMMGGMVGGMILVLMVPLSQLVQQL